VDTGFTIGIRAIYIHDAFSDGEPATTSPENALGTLKLRLTLFLPPNLGFGESFC
jgi:hypothetical protein